MYRTLSLRHWSTVKLFKVNMQYSDFPREIALEFHILNVGVLCPKPLATSMMRSVFHLTEVRFPRDFMGKSYHTLHKKMSYPLILSWRRAVSYRSHSANHWTGFYMIGSSVMKELRISSVNVIKCAVSCGFGHIY